jgi:radical SAM superfamily enzyme YgiQ (UPF0313 family)
MNAPVTNAIPKLGPTRDWTAVDAAITSIFPQRSIRRVLLVSPPDADASIFRYDTARRGRYTNYPPYGLAILAKQLRRANIDARVLNLNHVILRTAHATKTAAEFDHVATWTAALDEAIAQYQPDLIGVTCMFTMTHTSLKQVCERAAATDIPVAIGGVHVTNDVERVLDDIPEASIAFLREGDHAIVRFVQAVNNDVPLTELGQVILNRSADASSQRYRFLTECLPYEEDISIIPAFDLLEIPEYSRYGTIGAFYCFKPKDTVFATTLSNRGCRAQCTFCSVRNFNGKGVRQRSYMNVVDEIQALVEQYGVGHIMWLDDDLLKDEQRALAMFNEIVRRNIKVTWDATNGLIASSCTEELVAAMAASGCIAVNIGMESGNPQILRQVKKPGTIRNFLSAAEIFRKYEQIHTSILLIVGFPNETMGMVCDTLSVAREMDCDWYRISQLQPLPNTPIYDAMVAQGLIQDVGSKELRFMGGAFGKQTEIEQGLRWAELGFREAFSAIPLDAVPSKEQVTDIWFYMNYHLNFHRLFTERRPIKIRQQLQNLKILSEVISPENGFALYFLGVLEHQLNHAVPPAIIERLRRRLETSPYWADRFAAFGLSVTDLETADFKNKHIPRLVPGGVIHAMAQ